MTIFVKASKILILKCLSKKVAKAHSNDGGMLGFFRDTQLSGQQVELCNALTRAIGDFVPAEGTDDKSSLDALKRMVLETDKKIEERRGKAGRGDTNRVLTDINSDLDRFYLELEKLRLPLIDKEDDDDPFNILCYHAAYYFGENIFLPETSSFGKTLFEMGGGDSSITIRTKKETCVLEQLLSCQRNLGALKEGYPDIRKDWVLREIDAIQRKNAEICNEAQLVPTIPVSVSVATVNASTPPIVPSKGRLEICMENAKKEVTALQTERTLAPAL